MRKLASIQRIDKIDPIPNADKIEVATVLGWHVVVKKGEFRKGDLCVYCEVDSILPPYPWCSFMEKYKYRVKTIKLRGQLSQGLVFSLSILPNYIIPKIGDDVTDILGVKKYEQPGIYNVGGDSKGNFPSFIPKTDEVRIQSVPEVLKRHENEPMFITEKIDGTSFTAFLKDNQFGVCSRNLEKKRNEDNLYWQTAIKYDLESILSDYGKDIAIQGEVIAPNVQKNKYRVTSPGLYVFSIFDIKEHKYYSLIDFVSFCDDYDLDYVPVLNEYFTIGTKSVDDLVEMARIESQLYPTPAEGIVIRSINNINDPYIGRLSFKVINPDFLLKYNL